MSRVLLVIAIVAGAMSQAVAQFGGMPGLPGGLPGGSPAETFRDPPHTRPPSGPPPKCQALLTIRDDLQKHGAAIRGANEKKADVKVACRLFRTYVATVAKMLRMLEADGWACGAGAQIIQQVRGSHAKAQQLGKQVCNAAARGPRPSGPTLYDALDTAPAAPDPDQMPFLYDGLWPPNRRP